SALRSYRDIIRVEATLHERERTLAAFTQWMLTNHPSILSEAVGHMPELESFVHPKSKEL
ncbi:MAG TPA: hypothetical protein VFM61_01795, partial [Pseudidiomarina sp.]|nr:hypothetical protein [Pseudidiomarina sp.]